MRSWRVLFVCIDVVVCVYWWGCLCVVDMVVCVYWRGCLCVVDVVVCVYWRGCFWPLTAVQGDAGWPPDPKGWTGSRRCNHPRRPKWWHQGFTYLWDLFVCSWRGCLCVVDVVVCVYWRGCLCVLTWLFVCSWRGCLCVLTWLFVCSWRGCLCVLTWLFVCTWRGKKHDLWC